MHVVGLQVEENRSNHDSNVVASKAGQTYQDADRRSSDKIEKRDGLKGSVGSTPQKKLYLKMSGLLSRNMLVNTSANILKAAHTSLHSVHSQSVQDVLDYYEKLLLKCKGKDSQLDRSDSIAHGKVREWARFCMDCAQLVHLRDYIFKLSYEHGLLDCKDEEEVRRMEAAMRAAAVAVAQCTTLAVESLVPGSWYRLEMGCLLLRNTYVPCKGEEIIQRYNTAMTECQTGRAAATAKFNSLHTICLQLDAVVAPICDNDHNSKPKWQSFCAQCVQVCMLRIALNMIYNYDPCQAMVEALEQAHRIPAPRKLMNRLHLANEPSSMQLTVHNGSDTHGVMTAKRDTAMDGIKTTANGDNSFICMVRDKTVYMLSNSLPNRTLALAQGVMLVLHVVGLIDGDVELTVSTTDLILAYAEAQLVGLTEVNYINTRDDVLAVNTDQLANLEQIGVPDASKKLCKFKQDLVRFLCLKQLKHSTPILARLLSPVDLNMTPAPVCVTHNQYEQLCCVLLQLVCGAGYVLLGSALLTVGACINQFKKLTDIKLD